MVVILGGNSGIGAHVRSYLCYLICSNHLVKSRAVTNLFFFLRKDLFSFMRALQVTILYKYHDHNIVRKIIIYELIAHENVLFIFFDRDCGVFDNSVDIVGLRHSIRLISYKMPNKSLYIFGIRV